MAESVPLLKFVVPSEKKMGQLWQVKITNRRLYIVVTSENEMKAIQG
jgi:hypothetical protein